MTGPGPSVFISHGEFVIRTCINANKNICTKKVPFEIGKKYHLKIQQIKLEEKTFYTIVVNELQVYSEQVFTISNDKNVAVYNSDPSYDAFTSEYGILQNFKYTAGK